MSEPSLATVGEFGLLRELERLGLAEAIGDDTAVLRDGLIVTQDALLEGIHFRLAWTSWRDLGYKAAAVNLSDLAAAGADPEALVVSLGLPSETEVAAVIELYEGLNEAGVPVRGGDTAKAERVYLSVTAVGRSSTVPGRAGARPGDVLIVTGPLGGAAAGMYVLEHGLEGFPELVRMHRRPPLRLEAGRRLAPIVHAMIDLSDGIAADAGHIAARSECRVVVHVDELPLAPRIGEVSPLPFWTMGEDYELLAALPAKDAAASGFAVVGECVEGRGVSFLERGRPVEVTGWDHFRSPGL